MLRRAFLAEQFALSGFQDAFEHFSALRRLGVGDANPWNVEAALGVKLAEAVAQSQSRL